VAMQRGSQSRITRTGQWVGTLDYLSPEQIRGEAVDASADVYALTALLYHCITGETPFPRASDAAIMWAHVSAPVPTTAEALPHLPGALDEVIARGMAKDPADRFRSAGELAAACARALETVAGETPRPAPVIRPPERRAPASGQGKTTPSD